MAPGQGCGCGHRWVWCLLHRGVGEGNDGTGRGPGHEVVRGGKERGDLKRRALVLANDWIVRCM